MRLSENYNAAQIKRILSKGIAELESKWELKSLPANVQFEKVATGYWIARFQRRLKQKAIEYPIRVRNTILDCFDKSNLAAELTRRGIAAVSASELVENGASTIVKTMIELFDWCNEHGQPRGAGFLVQAIRNPQDIVLPRGFESSKV